MRKKITIEGVFPFVPGQEAEQPEGLPVLQCWGLSYDDASRTITVELVGEDAAVEQAEKLWRSFYSES